MDGRSGMKEAATTTTTQQRESKQTRGGVGRENDVVSRDVLY